MAKWRHRQPWPRLTEVDQSAETDLRKEIPAVVRTDKTFCALEDNTEESWKQCNFVYFFMKSEVQVEAALFSTLLHLLKTWYGDIIQGWEAAYKQNHLQCALS